MDTRLPPGLHPPVEVALARVAENIPKTAGSWQAEPKWDGYRAIIARDGEDTTLWSRQGKNLGRYFPDLLAAATMQLPPGCLIDGEAVIWSNDRLDFSALQQRLTTSTKSLAKLVREKPAHFVAFDLLAVAGHDTRQEPLRSRRALLEELAKDWEAPLDLSPATTDPAEAQTWFKELPATGVEGLILKKTTESYAGGQRIWQKLKHRESVDVICGAVIGPINRPEAIVAGLPTDGELRIVGRSAPLKAAAAKLLGTQLQAAGPGHPWPRRVKSTALDRFNADKDETELTLVEPIVVEVSADTAMTGTSFRHAVRFLRARPELPPEDLSSPFDKP